MALDPHDPRLVALVTAIETIEQEHAQAGYPKPERDWLLGTMYFDLRLDLWRHLRATILGAAVRAHPVLQHLAWLDARLRQSSG